MLVGNDNELRKRLLAMQSTFTENSGLGSWSLFTKTPSASSCLSTRFHFIRNTEWDEEQPDDEQERHHHEHDEAGVRVPEEADEVECQEEEKQQAAGSRQRNADP